MDNKQEFFKSKCEGLFDNALQLLEKVTETQLASIEKMKYDFHDNCSVILSQLVVIEDETEHLETNPNKKPAKKEEEAKKPLKNEENRSKTPTRIASKPAITNKHKRKEKTIEAPKTNEKKKPTSTTTVAHKEEEKKNVENAHPKTADKKGMKKSPTVGPPKKTPGRKIDGKHPAKTPRASDKKGFESTKESDTKKTNDEDNDDIKEENIKNCISNITIAPQLIPKYIYKIPSDIKENNQIAMLYILSKTSFLKPKEKYTLIISCSLLFKLGYKSSLSFMLDDKKAKLRQSIQAIQTLFSSYGDIESYLSKAFSPSKTAQNSLTFVTKEEELSLSKREDLPKEIGIIFQLVYIIIDVPFDESLPINKLIENLINNVLPQFDVKDISKH